MSCPSLLVVGTSGSCVGAAVGSSGDLVAGQTLAWNSSDTAAVAIDASGAVEAGVAPGAAQITCTVQGSLEAASSPATINVLPNVDAGLVRVIVVDDYSGAPISGATVVVSPVDGGSASLVTGDAGIVEFAAAPPLSEVSVYHASYNYVTVVGYAASDMQVAITPAPDSTKAGGIHGTFSYDMTGVAADKVEIGIAGLSFPGTMLDFSFDLVVGEQVPTSLMGLTLKLPRGVFAYLEPTALLVREYQALGLGGKRVRWGLATREAVATVLTLAGVASDPGAIVTALVPILAKSNHTLQANYTVTEIPTISDSDGGTTPDFANMPNLTLSASRPLSTNIALDVPRLPSYGGAAFLKASVGVIGALVPGQGFTPLGLGAARDTQSGGETPDGIVDTDLGDAGNQTVMPVQITPSYGGIEGAPYLVLLLASSFSGTAADAPPVASSSLLKVYQPSQVMPESPTTVAFEPFDAGAAVEFLALPIGATYDAGARVLSAVPTISGARLHRLVFGTSRVRRWFIYFIGSSVTVPTPPSAEWNLATDALYRIDSIALTGTNSLQSLFGVGAPNGRNLTTIMTAFSALECKNGVCTGQP